jgi:DNA-binding transcriptional MerR regulator
MDKSPEAFRTISEVADWLGTPTHVLRFWESRFTQVKPVKRAGGRRYYRPRDMELLGGIKKLLHDDGMTIRGVQKLLREEGVRHVSALSPQIGPDDGDAVRDSDVIEARASEAPMAVDVPRAKPQNVVPIKAPPATAPTPRAKTAAPEAPAPESTPETSLGPALGPRGDVLVGPDETPLAYRTVKGQQAPASPPNSPPESPPASAPAAPPVALGRDVPDDPGDAASSPPDAGSVIGALRRARTGKHPIATDPKAASELYRRLDALRKRMDPDSDTDPA